LLFFYIRHGEPIYVPNKLTPLGERQAEAVAKRLAMHGIDEIYASPSARAYQTAQPTADILGKEITQLDFCNESHAWEEFRVDDGNGRQPWVFSQSRFKRLFSKDEVVSLGDKWYEYPEFKQYSFEKGVKRVNAAVDEFFAGLGYEHNREERIYNPVNPNEKRIALFAHQGFGMIFLSSVLDIPYPLVSTRFDIEHSGMTVIEFKEEEGIVIPKVLTLSNDSHIYRDGLPTVYNRRIRF